MNSRDYKKWIEPADGLLVTYTSNEKLRQKRKYYIPNTVYAYWAGEAGPKGKWYVGWDPSVSYLNKLGFKVIDIDHRTGDKRFLQGILAHAASGKTLHGLYFWGHGYSPYPSSGLTSPTGDPVVMYSEINLVYRMALGLVFACDTNSGKNVLFSNAPGGIWNGYSGTLVPLFKFFHVRHWIKSGDQGTK